MKGQDFDLFGIVEGKDDLVVVDEHRVQDELDEPLLAVIMDRHDLLYFNTKIFVLDFLPGSILVHFELDFKEVFRLFRILVE